MQTKRVTYILLLQTVLPFATTVLKENGYCGTIEFRSASLS